MKCPFCGFLDTRVLDTRIQQEGDIIRRRRECPSCKGRFSTRETHMQSYPFVIKKDGRREPYIREKVHKSVQLACQKRPISLAQMEAVVDRVSGWVLSRNESEISTKDIGIKVMFELRLLDDVAYVRFASVYKTFKDVNEFVQTLNSEPNHDEEEMHLSSPPME